MYLPPSPFVSSKCLFSMKPSFPFNCPPGSSPSPLSSVEFPFDGFPQFQLEFPAAAAAAAESGGAEPDQVAVAQPLECLQGNPVFPFLSKTYDLVEDPSLDPIISWGEKGNSIVVWEPAYLATIVLPRYFKHDNFTSFVRQLNTYGFRKIDTNKWEFANEFFVQGSKHLLKNIQRRKSPHPQQVAAEASGPDMETQLKLEKLRTEKSVIMQELAELRQQHRQTAEYMETIKQKLRASEKRQKQMVYFLARVVQNPESVESVIEMKEQSPRTRRKIVNLKTQERVKSSGMKSSLPFQTENVSSNELVEPQYLTSVPVQIGSGDSNPDNGGFSSLEFGHFVDFPEELATDKAFTEFSAPVKKEESLSMSSPTLDSWITVGSHNFAVNGGFFSGGLLDTWELSDLIFD